MTAILSERSLRLLAGGVLGLASVLLVGLDVMQSVEARPGGRGGGGGGARMNVGGGFNGPRSFGGPSTRPSIPSRPSGVGQQRPPSATQLPSTPSRDLAPRPTPPIAGADRPSRPPGAGQAPPRPTHPIAGAPPDRPGSRPPDRPVDRPPGYYPPYYPDYWPGYWPPPYPPYDESYPPPEPPPAPAVGTIVGTVPAGCQQIGVAGKTYLMCGSTWYAPHFSGNQVVYMVVAPPT